MHSVYLSVFLSYILPKHTKENVFVLFSSSNLLLVCYHSTERDVGICEAFNSSDLMLLFVEFTFVLFLTSKEPKTK